jgi:hypothetical protein
MMKKQLLASALRLKPHPALVAAPVFLAGAHASAKCTEITQTNKSTSRPSVGGFPKWIRLENSPELCLAIPVENGGHSSARSNMVQSPPTLTEEMVPT